MATVNGNTCLHAAVVKGHVSTALLLCNHGAELFQKNNSGSTPLDVALEFGSFTCERELRLSQWDRRKAKLNSDTLTTTTSYAPDHHHTHLDTTNYTTPTLSESIDDDIDTLAPDMVELSSTMLKQMDEHSTLGNNIINVNDDVEAYTKGYIDISHGNPKRVITRARSAKVNHEMPPSAKAKKQQRLARAKSAPPLNSEERHRRLCRGEHASHSLQSEQQSEVKERQQFTVTRPQYLQFIKSSTGVVEEDYFADIFPDQEDGKTKNYRSFDDQMARNERIFKKMFKESGIAHQDSASDSEEEKLRKYANKKAVRRWAKKKQLQKEEEQAKKAFTPSYPTDKSKKKECLGELLMIGDTSSGRVTSANPETYLTAYQTYRQGPRAKSATTSSARKSTVNIDPMTYEEWVEGKPKPNKPDDDIPKRHVNKQELTKRIDYETWLNKANHRHRRQLQQLKKEEKHKKDFEAWIQELKDEVGTYDYWKRRKEEQLKKERQIQRKKEQEEQKKAAERAEKKKMAKDVYKHWVINKEIAKLEEEEIQLQREKERLNSLKQKT